LVEKCLAKVQIVCRDGPKAAPIGSLRAWGVEQKFCSAASKRIAKTKFFARKSLFASVKMRFLHRIKSKDKGKKTIGDLIDN
jgi:hypothetical protein